MKSLIKTSVFILLLFWASQAGATTFYFTLNQGPATLDANTYVTPAGYYQHTTLNAVDTDLAAGNIRNGVTIFGITGTDTAGSYYGLPKTGQITRDASYLDDGYYASPEAGKDVGYPQGKGSWTAYMASRFTTYESGGQKVVTDNATRLMWQVKPSNEATLTYDWESAKNYCNTLTWAGYTGWRLPNIMELETIVDHMLLNPSIYPIIGTCDASAYWSSTTVVATIDTSTAATVSFSDGCEWPVNKGTSLHYRAVRGAY